MTDPQLLEAQQERDDRILDYDLDQILDRVFSASDVGPEARAHLRGILKHYAKNPHPFRACVRDNMKRFGPGRTEKVCATLKDMIRGTTRWRHGEGGMAGSDQFDSVYAYTFTNEERAEILTALSDEDIAALEEVIVGGS